MSFVGQDMSLAGLLGRENKMAHSLSEHARFRKEVGPI
jgi:hypothetical protein